MSTVLTKNNILSILLCLGIGISSYFLGGLFPIVGAPIIAIVIGVIIAQFFKIPDTFRPGIKFTSKKILQYAIVMLGGAMSIQQVLQVGASSIGLILITMIIAFLASYIINRFFKISFNLSTLITCGTSICGGSAIAAVAPAVNADDSEIAYSISIIFFFNVIAAIVFPPLGHIIGLSQLEFGLWSGTAVNDTSSVVAAAFAYGDFAGHYAVIVKLARTLMIIPLTFIFAIIAQKRAARLQTNTTAGKNVNLLSAFPLFILGFVLMAVLNGFGLFSADFQTFFAKGGKFMISVAMAAIGLSTNLKSIKQSGLKPVLLGLLLWIVLSISSIIQIKLFS